MICPDCAGKGIVLRRYEKVGEMGTEACETCEGTGEVEDLVCVHCGGVGYRGRKANLICADCKGTGIEKAPGSESGG